MLDIAALAGTAVTTILLPYVKDGAAKLIQTVSEAKGAGMGEYAADLAGKVWDKVKSAFGSEKEKAVLEQFEEEPEAAAPLVVAKLQKKLEEDPQLKQELEKLVESKGPDGSTGAQIIGSSYVGIIDMRNANISGSGQSFTGGSFNVGAEPLASSIRPPQPSPVPQPTKKDDE